MTKLRGEIELPYMFYMIGISSKEGVDTELYEILLFRYEESNRPVQLWDSVFIKQR